MFHRILVPLDGTKRAESVIPVAANIARTTGGSLVLLRVVPLPAAYVYHPREPFLWPQEGPTTDKQIATMYLAQLAQTAPLRGITVQTTVLTGVVEQQMLFCIEEQAIDLVVLCSRGEAGIKRWAFGSVAQNALRHSSVPVLILHEAAGLLSNQHPAGPRPIRVLVPLDGSVLAETALKPAAALSAILSAPEKGQLHVVRVLPLPEPMSAVEEMNGARQLDISAGQTYLQSTVEAWQEKADSMDIPSIEASVVEHPEVAENIIRIAEEGFPATEKTAAKKACDVIALTTHGRSGLTRWAMGSIAERILDGSRLPLLAVHASWSGKQHLPG